MTILPHSGSSQSINHASRSLDLKVNPAYSEIVISVSLLILGLLCFLGGLLGLVFSGSLIYLSGSILGLVLMFSGLAFIIYYSMIKKPLHIETKRIDFLPKMVQNYFDTYFTLSLSEDSDEIRRFHFGHTRSGRHTVSFAYPNLTEIPGASSRSTLVQFLDDKIPDEHSFLSHYTLEKCRDETFIKYGTTLGYGDFIRTRPLPGNDGITPPWTFLINVLPPDPKIHSLKDAFFILESCYSQILFHCFKSQISFCRIPLVAPLPANSLEKAEWKAMGELALLKSLVNWSAKIPFDSAPIHISVVRTESLSMEESVSRGLFNLK